jgi:hypothetical protein
MKETILIIGFLLNLYCIYISLERISNYDKKIGIPKKERSFLRYISILIPIIGFFLTQKLRIKEAV